MTHTRISLNKKRVMRKNETNGGKRVAKRARKIRLSLDFLARLTQVITIQSRGQKTSCAHYENEGGIWMGEKNCKMTILGVNNVIELLLYYTLQIVVWPLKGQVPKKRPFSYRPRCGWEEEISKRKLFWGLNCCANTRVHNSLLFSKC